MVAEVGRRADMITPLAHTAVVHFTVLEAEEADVLAVFVEPAECWYLIPVEKLTSKSVYLSPEDDSSVGRYEPWKEAWNVFA